MCAEAFFQPAPHLNLGSLLAEIPLLHLAVFHNFSFSFSFCISLYSLSCMFWFFPSPSLLYGQFSCSQYFYTRLSLHPPLSSFSISLSSLCSPFLMIFTRVCRCGSSQVILWSVNSASEQRCASCMFSSLTIQSQMYTHKHKYTALW